jgi:hypothetical protein
MSALLLTQKDALPKQIPDGVTISAVYGQTQTNVGSACYQYVVFPRNGQVIDLALTDTSWSTCDTLNQKPLSVICRQAV